MFNRITSFLVFLVAFAWVMALAPLEGLAAQDPEINVTGNGVSIPYTSPVSNTPSTTDDTLWSPAVPVGNTVTHTFTIENSAQGVLNITSIGGATAHFSFRFADSASPCGTLNTPTDTVARNGGSETFCVDFHPQTATTGLTTVVSIANNDPNEAPYEFNIEGDGVGAASPEINVQGGSPLVSIPDGSTTTSPYTGGNGANFPDTTVGSTPVSQQFTIQNTDTGTLNITSITTSNSTDYSIVYCGSLASPPTTIAGSSSATFCVEFDPQSESSGDGLTSTITINNDDADEAVYDYLVDGDGIVPEINVRGGAGSNNIADGSTTPTSDFATGNGTNFPDTVVGTGPVSQVFTIENTKTGTLNITSITTSNGTDYSIVYCGSLASPPTTIAGSSSATFCVEFDPQSIGTLSSTITINNDDANEAVYDYLVDGDGLAPPPEINVTGGDGDVSIPDGSTTTTPYIGGNGANFPDTKIGSTPVSQMFTIENTVATSTLNITSITTSNSTDYSLDFTCGTLATPPTTVAGSGTGTFCVVFDPQSETSGDGLTSTITINNDDADEAVYDYLVDGDGIVPEINVTGGDGDVSIPDGSTTTTPYIGGNGANFPDTKIGSTPVSQMFTIENTKTATLDITSITTSNSTDYSLDFTCGTLATPPTTVAGSSSATFCVVFDPQSETSGDGLTSTITINNDDANEAVYDYLVDGDGIVPEINVTGGDGDVSIADGSTTPTTPFIGGDGTNFPDTIVGAAPVSQMFTIENTKTATLDITSITTSNSTDYSLDFTCGTLATPPTTVAGSSSATFCVVFDPQSVTSGDGLVSTITINNDDPNEGTYDYRVDGDGLASPPEINVTGGDGDVSIPDGSTTTTPFIGGNGANFPDTTVGSTPVSQLFTIENTGTGTLNVTSITTSNTTDYSLDFTCGTLATPPTTVAGSSGATFCVVFDPQSETSGDGLTSTITINNDDPNEAVYDYLVDGDGIVPEINVTGGDGDVSIADGSTTPTTPFIGGDGTNFPDTTIGTGPVSQMFTIENTKTATLDITSITTSNSTDYSLDFTCGTLATPPTTVAGSSSATFCVEFDPQSATSGDGLVSTITINNDDPNEGTYDYRVDGDGLAGAAEINVTGGDGDVSIADGSTTPTTPFIGGDGTNFPDTTLGTGPVSQMFTIENTVASSTLSITSITTSNTTDYSLDFTCGTLATPPTTINGVGGATFCVEFDPQSTTSGDGLVSTITINNDDPNEGTYDYRVDGDGVAGDPEINLTGGDGDVSIPDGSTTTTPYIGGNGANFPDTEIGSTPVSQMFTIENTNAGSTLNITSITTSNTTDYSLDFTCGTLATPPTTVAGSGTGTFCVVFDPQSETSGDGLTSTITINNDDTDEAVYDYLVDGDGINLTPVLTLPTWSGFANSPDYEVTLGATITEDGGTSIDDYGTVWSATETVPTFADNKDQAGTSFTPPNSYTHTVGDSPGSMPPGKTIYWRGYAHNTSGRWGYTTAETVFSEPDVQASSVIISNVNYGGFQIDWTAGDRTDSCDGSIVLVRFDAAVVDNPVDGTDYAANTRYEYGDEVGSGNETFVVYSGSATSVTVDGLSGPWGKHMGTFYVAVYEFCGSGTGINYLTTGPATGSEGPLPKAPSHRQAYDIDCVQCHGSHGFGQWIPGGGVQEALCQTCHCPEPACEASAKVDVTVHQGGNVDCGFCHELHKADSQAVPEQILWTTNWRNSQTNEQLNWVRGDVNKYFKGTKKTNVGLAMPLIWHTGAVGETRELDEPAGNILTVRNSNDKLDRLCQICHTNAAASTAYHTQDPVDASIKPTDATYGYRHPENYAGLTDDCRNCHTHLSGFAPVGGGSCTDASCHGEAKTGATPRRQIVLGALTVSDFDTSKQSHHVNDGTGDEIVTKWDCALCHAEGDPITGDTDATYHMNGTVDLENSDGAVTSLTDANGVYVDWPNLVAEGRDQFCLSCHDDDGATVLGAPGSETRTDPDADAITDQYNPFKDSITNHHEPDGFDGAAAPHIRYRTTGQGNAGFAGVVDIKTLLDETNASYHNIDVDGDNCVLYYDSTSNPDGCSGPNSLDFNGWDAGIKNAITGVLTLAWNTELHCEDCHYGTASAKLNGHGTTNSRYMLRNSAGNDAIGTFDTKTLNCHRCHDPHTNVTNYPDHAGQDGNHQPDSSNLFGIGCMNCHGGGMAETFSDKGTPTAYVSGGLQWGMIHGVPDGAPIPSDQILTPNAFVYGAGLGQVENWDPDAAGKGSYPTCGAVGETTAVNDCTQHNTGSQNYDRNTSATRTYRYP